MRREISGLSSLENPVVVSNGRIHSQASMDHLFASTHAPRCPLTRELLRRNCYGPEGAKTSYVHLPQIAAAVVEFKQRLKVARALETLSTPDNADKTLNLILKISRNKLRIVITASDTDSTGTPPEILTNFMRASFPDPRSEIKISRTTQSYFVRDYGRCWQAHNSEARIDFWYPLDNLTVGDINNARDALLAPLASKEEATQEELDFGSLSELGQRQYMLGFETINLPLAQIAQCCDSFMAFTKALIKEKGQTKPNDVVQLSETAATTALHSRKVLPFVTSGTGGAISAPPPSAPFASSAPFTSSAFTSRGGPGAPSAPFTSR